MTRRTHLIGAPTPAPAPRPLGPWGRLSAALTEQVVDLADREDLTVTCPPASAPGARGCSPPLRAPLDRAAPPPAPAPPPGAPARPSARARYPALGGGPVHEAAPPRHSAWKAPEGAGAAHVEAATTLE